MANKEIVIDVTGYAGRETEKKERPTIVIDKKTGEVNYYNVQPKSVYLQQQKANQPSPEQTAREKYEKLLSSIGMSRDVPLLAQINNSTDKEFLKQYANPNLFGSKEEQKIAAAAESRLLDLQWYGSPDEEVNLGNAYPHYLTKTIKGAANTVEGALKFIGNYGSFGLNKAADFLDDKGVDSSGIRSFSGALEKGKQVLTDSPLPDSQRKSVGAWQIGDAVAEGVGNTATTAAMNLMIPGSGLPFLGASAAGNASEEALQDGAEIDKALIYGIASGATEVATELLFDSNLLMHNGVAFGRSIDNVLDSAIGKFFKSSVGRSVANFLKENLEEGAEEYISEVVGEYLTDIYKRDKPNESFGDYINRFIQVQPQAFEAGLVGALSSAVTNGLSVGANAFIGTNGNQSSNESANNETNKPVIDIPSTNSVTTTNTIDNQMISNDINRVQPQTIENNSQQLEAIEGNGIQQSGTEKIPESTQFVIDSLNSKNSAIKFQAEKSNEKIIQASAKQAGIIKESDIKTITEISNKMGVPVRFVESLEYGADGVYKDGTIYISKTASDPAMTVFVHEMTHHIETSGLYNEFKSELLKLAGMNEDYQGRDIKSLAANVKRSYAEFTGNELQLDDAASEAEVIAKLAQEFLFKDEASIRKLAQSKRNLAQRIYDWIKETLSKFVLHNSPYKEQLSKCEKLYREAIKDADSGVVKVGNIQYSLHKSLEEQVNEVLSGKADPYNAVYMRDTPKSLIDVGLKQRPMLITQKHVRSMILDGPESKHYHNLGVDIFLKIPEAMEQPKLIAKSKNDTVIMILDLYDNQKRPIIVAIKPDGKSYYNKIIVDSNHILSAYGRNNIEDFVNGLYEHNQIIFPKKIKKEQLEDLIPRLQLPSNRSSNVPKYKISQKQESVNARKKDLLAIHNITPTNMQKSMELGGLAMPSIAVTKGSIGHDEFGDISLVFKKDSIDPKVSQKNKIYSKDAWTPTFPYVETEVNKASANEAKSYLRQMSKKVDGYFASDVNRFLNDFVYEDSTTKNIDDLLQAAENNYGMKAAFLEEKNQHINPASEVNDERLKYSQKDVQRMNHMAEEYEKMGVDFRNSSGKEIINEFGVDPVKRLLAEELMQRGLTKEEAIEKVDKYPRFKLLAKINKVQSALEIFSEKYVPKNEINTEETNRQIDNQIDSEEYKNWIRNKLGGIFGKKGIRNDKENYTGTGNRRSFSQLHEDYTLDNVVNYMENQTQTGKVGFGSGLNTILAARSKAFNSIDDVIANEDLLSEKNESYKAKYDTISNEFNSIRDSIIETYKWSSAGETTKLTDFAEAGVNAAKLKNLTIVGVKNAFGKRDFNISNDQATKFINLLKAGDQLTTDYFEAKPQRAVSFDEVNTAVVPKGLDPALKEQMEASGIKLVEYDPDVEGDRSRVLKKLENLKFSMPISADEALLNKKRTKSKSEAVQSGNRRTLMNNVKDLFYVDSKSAKSDLLPIIMEIEAEYRNTGKIRKELKNKLFKSAWDVGRVVDQAYIEQYGDVREDIKGRKIKIDSSFKGDIPDFSDLKKRYAGTLNFSNAGTPIDVIYQELSSQNPGIFDPEITHPADQLIAIMDMLDDIRLHESSLDVTFKDDPDFKEYVWNGLNKAVTNFQHETDLTMRYEKYRNEQKQKTEETDPLPAEQIQSIYKEKQRLEKIKDGVSRKTLLNDKDRVQLDRLLKGEIEFADLPRDVNYNGIKQMYDIQKQINDVTEPITRYNKARKQALYDKAMNLLKNSMKWTDKVTGLQYSRETMERNVRDITHNKEETKAINDYLFKPIHDHEAAAIRFKNEFRDRVRAMHLTKTESELVQKYGEGEIKAEDFYALDVDHAKIEKAIKEFRTIYSDLFDRINIARVQNGYAPMEFRKDYFPHFSERMSLLAKIGKKLGMEIHDESLPTDIAGLTHTFRPGIKWFANALQRQGTKTAYDAVEGFNRYVEGAADIIYHTEDIQKLRAFEQALRYKHSDAGMKDEIENIRENNNLTDDEKNAQIDDLTRGEINNLGHFATELRSYTDNLAGKKSFSDRSIEQDIGRRYYSLASAMESRVASNMVALNPGSWLTNFIPITQASSQVSMQSMTKALEATMRNYVENDGFEIESTFLTNRLGSESLTKTSVQKVSETLAAPMQWIDEFASNVVVRAKYYENLKNGMEQTSALADADQFAANLIADRSKGSMPTLFNRKNPVTKIFTQFQLEQNNQLSYLLKDVPRDLKDKGLKVILMALLKYSIGAYLYNEIYGALTGRHPALDPARMIKDAVIRFADKDKKKSEAVLETGKDVLEQVPFVGGLMGGGRLPINSALPNMTNVINAGVGLATGEMDERKAKDTLGKELSKPAFYFLPPVAGGQAKKFFEGMSAIGRGGVFGVDSEGRDTLKYYVEPTFGNTLKSAVFGPTSTDQGKKWIESGFPSLSGKRTEAYKDLVTAGIDMKYAYEFMEYVKSLKGLKDANGNTIPNSKSALMIDKLQGLGLQGSDLKNYIQDNGNNLGISEKIQNMTVEDIRKLIKECKEKEGK